MKAGSVNVLLLVVVVVLAVTSGAWARTVRDHESMFRAWLQEHQKSYLSEAQYQFRLGVFQSNLALIDQLNANGDSAVYAMNQYGDLTPQEFKKKYLMTPLKPQSIAKSRLLPAANVGDLPASFDWRERGAVTPVKDQGSVGSCWSFSTTGNIEGQWFLAGHSLPTLSEEQLVDCDYKDCGVFGGWPYLAMEYIIAVGGIQSEETYPYCSGTGGCYPCMANHNKTFCGPGPSYCARNCNVDTTKFVAHISSWAATSQNETEIAEQLVARGPLSILLDATPLQFYHHGVLDPPSWLCPADELDHAVLLVGYGSEKDILGTVKDFWIVKNSWGAKWGEEGYFRIYRGKGTCGINSQAITAVL